MCVCESLCMCGDTQLAPSNPFRTSSYEIDSILKDCMHWLCRIRPTSQTCTYVCTYNYLCIQKTSFHVQYIIQSEGHTSKYIVVCALSTKLVSCMLKIHSSNSQLVCGDEIRGTLSLCTYAHDIRTPVVWLLATVGGFECTHLAFQTVSM